MNEKNTSLDTYKRVIHTFVMPHRKKIFFAVFFMIIGSLATSFLPYSLKPVFDKIFVSKDGSVLFIVCLSVLSAFIIKGISAYAESVLMNQVGQRIITDIQKKLASHLLYQDLEYFIKTSSGQIISYFTSDVIMMRNAMATTLMGIGKDLFTLIFLLALMFYTDPILSCITFIVFPTAFYPILKLGRKMRKVTHLTQDSQALLSHVLGQIFRNIRVVKSFIMERKENENIEVVLEKIFNLSMKAARTRFASHPIVETVGGIAIVSVIAYGGYEVVHNSRTPGDFMTFIAALLLIYEPIKRLSNLNTNLQEGLAASNRIFDVLDTPIRVEEAESPLVLEKLKGSIDFVDVRFSYTDPQTQNKIDVLKGLNFSIQPGETVAFVGPSGSGKSTLLNLIPRFFDACSGEVLIDKHDVKKFSLSFLRDQISIVNQDVHLFDRTVFDNIAYLDRSYAREDVVQAAINAESQDFIQNLPQGYETEIGENGIRLSGGQKQRLSIARAFLKNSPILLLDEATSSLDTESEKKIKTTLNKLMKDRTTIIVAHRLSTVVEADIIHVLDQGVIVETGSHSTLLASNGIYANLWNKQLNQTMITD